MEQKWDTHIVALLQFSTQFFVFVDSFAARFSLKCESKFRSLLMCFLTFDSFAARFSLTNENKFRYLMFFRYGLLAPFCPPDPPFYRLLASTFDQQGPKHRQKPPRTCQEPAKNLPTHKTHNDAPHRKLLIKEPRQPPRNAEPEFGGRRCARRMASSIRSGPGGARGVFGIRSGVPSLYFLYREVR